MLQLPCRARSAVHAVAGRLGTGVDHTPQREGTMTYFDVSQESSNSRSSGEWVIRTVSPFVVSTTRCSPTQRSPVERMENRSPTPARTAGKGHIEVRGVPPSTVHELVGTLFAPYLTVSYAGNNRFFTPRKAARTPQRRG